MKPRYRPGHRYCIACLCLCRQSSIDPRAASLYSGRELAPSGPQSPWALSSPTGWLCGGAPGGGSPRGPDSRRFDKDIFDLDAADVDRTTGSAVSSLSPGGPEDLDGHSGGNDQSAGLLVVDVLACSDQAVEEVILAPNVHKLPESALVKVSLQSNSEKVRVDCVL